MLENSNVFSVNQMLFNIRYYFNAGEQACHYLLLSDVCSRKTEMHRFCTIRCI